jgi:Putative beta-barrel porin 2
MVGKESWRIGLAGLLLMAAAAPARAQDVQIAGQASPGEGDGVHLGGSLVFKTSLGAELGYTSNVFYEEAARNPDASAMARLLATFDLTSAPLPKDSPKRFDFLASLSATYQEYLSGDDKVTSQRDVALSALLRAIFFAGPHVSLGVEDSFTRAIQPTDFSDNLNRDLNRAAVWVGWKPGEGAVEVKAGYAYNFDLFESDSTFGQFDRAAHEFFLNAKWQYLPITRFTFDYNQQITNPDADSGRSAGAPMKLTVGVSTLFSPKTHVAARIGYGNGFYDDRAAALNTANYSSVLAGVDLSWLPTPLARLTLSYEHNFADSVFSNFYVDDVVRLRYDQNTSGRLAIRAKAEYRHRSYEGLPDIAGTTFNDTTRTDNIITGEALVDYALTRRYFVGAGYVVVSDQSDFRITQGSSVEDPSYIRHEVFAKFSAAF